jgi:AraC family transcriptional regulator
MYPVDVVERPARRVIGVAHRGPYEQIGGAFERLGAEAAAKGLWPEAVEVLGIYFDDPRSVPAGELRSFAGIAVREELALPDGFDEVRLPAGRHAVLHHQGSYAGLPEAWAWLTGEWLPESGLGMRAAAPCEVYLNAPGEVPEAELRTDVCLPVL